ncbi:hypothetical protein [Hyalangium rubrum]|uniref:MoaD/ThiS family protein n=1 Tax=Hyalangium rubrum TaxID=3103134 RepID=A0ABU5H5N1_9BACT|nr:hypothetical protein [Hyalangium sp. s54d21]MDY7228768.1 hypothetical protein [Hyalangium sp. s54d21]
MARPLDITVVVAPSLRGAFEGRQVVNLGVPATAHVGDVLETLLRLYPRLNSLLAGDKGPPGGRYLHVALDEHASRELAQGRGGLAAGHKVFIFALSRPPASSRTSLEG